MRLFDLKTSALAFLIMEFSSSVNDDEERLFDLEEQYPDQVENLVEAFNAAVKSKIDLDFQNIILILSEDEKIAKIVAKDTTFTSALHDVLEDPSQDDFYGTEGWEHYLGYD